MLTGTQAVRGVALREALEAAARFRGVGLRPLHETVQGLAALRASTYQAYRRDLGATATDLPEAFHETISAAIAFVDPVLAGMDGRATGEPHERCWE